MFLILGQLGLVNFSPMTCIIITMYIVIYSVQRCDPHPHLSQFLYSISEITGVSSHMTVTLFYTGLNLYA